MAETVSQSQSSKPKPAPRTPRPPRTKIRNVFYTPSSPPTSPTQQEPVSKKRKNNNKNNNQKKKKKTPNTNNTKNTTNNTDNTDNTNNVNTNTDITNDTNENETETIINNWNEEEEDMDIRTRAFQNLMVKCMSDLYKRLKSLEKVCNGSQHDVQELQEVVKDIEVEAIAEKAADNAKATYYYEATNLATVESFAERKFLIEFPVLEVAEVASTHCKLIVPERLGKQPEFKTYTLRCMSNNRYEFSNKVQKLIMDYYNKQFKKVDFSAFHKGKREKGKRVKQTKSRHRHALRRTLWEKMGLKEGESVKEHATVVLSNLCGLEETTDWTASDKAFARVVIELFLRVSPSINIEKRYQAIRKINNRSEDDPDQLAFEYTDSDEDSTDESSQDEDDDVDE